MTDRPTPYWVPTPESCRDALRQAQATELGLPSTATLEEISAKRLDLMRQEWARDRELPVTASWSEINAYDHGIVAGTHNGDALRRSSARKLGLPESASWETIEHTHKRNLARMLAEAPPL